MTKEKTKSESLLLYAITKQADTNKLITVAVLIDNSYKVNLNACNDFMCVPS